jgi:hypothetical protein
MHDSSLDLFCEHEFNESDELDEYLKEAKKLDISLEYYLMEFI